MSARIDKSAIGIVVAVAGMALCVALAYAMQAIRVYGPIVREYIHATLTPQFAAGMFFGIGLVLVGALIFAYGERR